MIAIVDYGLGNVQAFLNVYRRQNIEATRARTPDELERAQRIILPGVGAFDHAMLLLNASGMRQSLHSMVFERRTPVLGVCVGMQLLAERSEEGVLPGLGWIPGSVRKLGTSDADGAPQVLPHMGWNDVTPGMNCPLFVGLERDARFYFLHSYYYSCNEPADSAALTSYGGEFTCAVQHDNVYGVQFHPEKSHRWGEVLLQNFASRT